MTSPLSRRTVSRRLAPMVAHSIRPTKRPREQEKRLGSAPRTSAPECRSGITGRLVDESGGDGGTRSAAADRARSDNRRMPPPLVRPATLADADGIALVHVRSWQSAYRGKMPQ